MQNWFKEFKNKISKSDDWFDSSNISFENDDTDLQNQIHNTQNLAQENKDQWEALLRGQVLATTSQKIFSYINVADQKAQMLIILNSIIIPLAISEINNPDLKIAATMATLSAVISILMCILCIYPKRRSGRKPDGSINHLHFADIGRLTERDYMMRFKPIYNNKSRLSEEMIKDIHDISRRILLPKFRWLKASYIVFFTGNLLSVIYILAHSWFKII